MSNSPKGCSFLIETVGSSPIFTPENFSEEQKMFAETTDQFMIREVLPHIAALENGDHDLMVSILKKAADIGILMVDVPEQYGGLQVDKTTSMIVTEAISIYAGFSVTFAAHTGIGSLPLVFFGTPAQKEKWLPRMGTGELLAAYALTEPGSGSDALAAKTKAILGDDGLYTINGSKMWITNAGFADIFTVFCQVEGSKFTAFLIEADQEGVSIGAEEHKMGIKASSTCSVSFKDVKVSPDNILGEIGKGHKIAFNILNIGRFKLGVGSVGAGKYTLKLAVQYAKERKQFGQPISDFGAIRSKIADMATRLYALESMSYRVAGDMDKTMDVLDSKADDYSDLVMQAIEEFAIEDSIMKVYGSETIDFIADEAVQIHGGYGYSSEYEVERMYRDSRINRIFEGTNEINRMLIPGMVLKRTMKGQLGLFDVIQAVDKLLKEPTSPEVPPREDDEMMTFASFITEQAKAVTMYVANQAIQKHMADLRDQQEILTALADLIIAVYAMDSVVTRTRQLIADTSFEKTELHRAATNITVATHYQECKQIGLNLLCHLADGEKLEAHLKNFERLTCNTQLDLVSLRRTVADTIIERERYAF